MKELDNFQIAQQELFKAFKLNSKNYLIDRIDDGRNDIWYLKEQHEEVTWANSKESLANGDCYSSEYKKVFKSGKFAGVVLVDGYVNNFSLRIFDSKNRLTDIELDELWDEEEL